MSTRPGRTAAVLLAVSLTGSALAAAPAGAAAPPSADPAYAALAATVAPLATSTYDVTMQTANSVSRGSVDPVHGHSAVVVTQDQSEFDETVDQGHIYLRMNIDPDTNKQLGVDPAKWMTLDPAHLQPNNTLPLQPNGGDPIDMAGILTGVTAVAAADPRHFTGTLDLTAISGRNTPDPDEVAQAGAAAKAVPFTAAADDQGRLTSFKVDTSGFDPGLAMQVDYSHYGAATPFTLPTTTVPAPTDLYDIFAR